MRKLTFSSLSNIPRLIATVVFVCLFASLCLFSCRENNIPVKDFTLGVSDIYAEVGESILLKPTITPANATIKSISWATGNKNIAKIDQNGKVEAIGVGQCTIKATLKDGSNRSAFCRIIVVDGVPQISLNKSIINMVNNRTSSFQLIPSVEPASSAKIIYNSSDTNVATVSQEGIIKPVGKGTTIVIATLDNNSRSSATCEVHVVNVGEVVSAIILDKDSLQIKPNEQAQINAIVVPEEAINKGIIWKSSNQSIATVDSTGKVYAKKTGEVTITATAEDGSGVSAECTVNVRIPLEGITFNIDKLNVQIGDPIGEVLNVNFIPAEATNRKIYWSSTDESIATVEAGRVKAKKFGSCQIIATSDEGGFQAVCDIGTVKRVTQLSVTNSKSATTNSITIQVTDMSLKITPVVLPVDATNKIVSFSSSNPEVANISVDTITNVCSVTPKKAGRCTISARATDGSQKVAFVDLNVVAVATEVHLSQGEELLSEVEGGSLSVIDLTTNYSESESETYTDITALIDPANTNDKTLDWTSTPPNIVGIATTTIPDNKDDERRITALNNGSTIIRVAAIDRNGQIYREFKVNVTTLAEDIVRAGENAEDTYYMTTNNTGRNLLSVRADVLGTSTNEARNRTVLWNTSDATIASISAEATDGNEEITIAALKAGTCTITASTVAEDSVGKVAKTTSWIINVVDMNLNYTSANLAKNYNSGTRWDNGLPKNYRDLKATYTMELPEDINADITWSVTDTSVVSIDKESTTPNEACRVNAYNKNKGTAIVTAKSNLTGEEKTFTARVHQGVSSVSVTRQYIFDNSVGTMNLDGGQTFAQWESISGSHLYNRIVLKADDDADNKWLDVSYDSSTLECSYGNPVISGNFLVLSNTYYLSIDCNNGGTVSIVNICSGSLKFTVNSYDGFWTGTYTAK